MASKKKSETDMETQGTTSDDKKSKSGKYNLRRKTLVVRKEVEKRLVSPKAPKAKSRPPPLSKYRRRAANSRERGRMQEINIAFQELQTVLPIHCLPEIDPKTGITKITTLRLAVNYIAALRGVLGEDSSTPELGKPGTSGQGEDIDPSGETVHNGQFGQTVDDGQSGHTVDNGQFGQTLDHGQSGHIVDNGKSSQTVDNDKSMSACGTPEQSLSNEESNIKPSTVPGSPDADCHRGCVSETGGSSLNSIPVVSNVTAEEQCRNVHIEEPAIQGEVTKYDSANVANVLGQSVDLCDREVSAGRDEPHKQSVGLYQTDLQYDKAFQESNPADIELRDQLLMNNSDIGLLQQRVEFDISHKEDQTLLTTSRVEKDIDLNIDSNNNLRDFDPSSFGLTGSVPFKDGGHHIESNLVPPYLSWIDNEVCDMDTDSVVDTQDTDMDIDTELLVYPDIIRAVINDQFD